MEDYKSAKVSNSADDLGLSSNEKFDAKTSRRGVTNEESQRPVPAMTEKVKTDRGSFSIK